MLHQRWLETSRRHAGRAAISEGETVLTFEELAAMAERAPVAKSPVIARSGGVGFFVEILRAWRDGQAVIPLEGNAAEPLLKKPPGGDIRLIKYTPGASGIPRAIFFNSAQVAADADRLVEAMALSPDVPNLGAISLVHSYGFSNVVLPLLLHGVPVHLAPIPFPRIIEEIFRMHDSLVVPGVPSMWRAWHRAGILKDAPIRLAVSAGSPLALVLEREIFAEAGLKVRNFYGASECGGISFDTSSTPRESAGDVGPPMRGVTVTDLDGRLLVRSDAVASGYDEIRGDDHLGDGIYLTRDMGMIDGHGKLHLTGTSGGAINVAGRKVSPAKVEAAVLATGLAKRVKVIGIPSADAERCEDIAALVEMGNPAELSGLKEKLAAELPSWEIPRHWKFEAEGWSLDAAELKKAFLR